MGLIILGMGSGPIWAGEPILGTWLHYELESNESHKHDGGLFMKFYI